MLDLLGHAYAFSIENKCKTLQVPGHMACLSHAARVILPFQGMKTTDGRLPTSARPTRWEAEPLYRRAADGFEAQLGPNHEHTLSCLSNFDRLLEKQGKLDEAGHSSLGNRPVVYSICQVWRGNISCVVRVGRIEAARPPYCCG